MLSPKTLISRLPSGVQHTLRCQKYRWQIKRGTFASTELEYPLMAELIEAGDWVLDIGANVGHYTRHFSELVGARGRVIAIEPNPETFSVLAANSRHFPHRNVTLLNLAASDDWRPVSMDVPRGATGLDGHYLAHIADTGETTALAASLDSLAFPRRIKLIKMDVERHEMQALQGLRRLIEKDRPVLVIEAGVEGIDGFAQSLGYRERHLRGSHNLVFISGANDLNRAAVPNPESAPRTVQ